MTYSHAMWVRRASTNSSASARVTADCPCVDPDIIDALVVLQDRTGADLCTNAVPRTSAKGLDVEMVTAEALATIDAGATTQADREHVLTYAYERQAPSGVDGRQP